jgi:hypothetical protein
MIRLSRRSMPRELDVTRSGTMMLIMNRRPDGEAVA